MHHCGLFCISCTQQRSSGVHGMSPVFLIQLMGNSSGGYSAASTPITSSLNLRQLCHCVIKRCMLECLFIINSLKHTCTLIMLFNQHLYLPHLSGGWIILKWSLTRLSANLYSERYNYLVCEIISFQFVKNRRKTKVLCSLYLPAVVGGSRTDVLVWVWTGSCLLHNDILYCWELWELTQHFHSTVWPSMQEDRAAGSAHSEGVQRQQWTEGHRDRRRE